MSFVYLVIGEGLNFIGLCTLNMCNGKDKFVLLFIRGQLKQDNKDSVARPWYK